MVSEVQNFQFSLIFMTLTVCIDYDDPLVAQLIQLSLARYIPDVQKASASSASLQWSSYEEISFETIFANPRTLCNSYIFRKALIRKHYLATTVQEWLTKHPGSILRSTVPTTHLLECDYAEYLDEALNEAFELEQELQNEEKMFILKPSMADRGQGIRLFATRYELQQIFEDFEEDEASNLRHFVVQEYIHPPLLFGGKKFHIRTYVVAAGAIKVWVWSEMLALFAAKGYAPESKDLDGHLTNTCLQEGAENVVRFWELALKEDALQGIFQRICEVTGEIFLAAGAGQQIHFQVRPENILTRRCQTCLRYLAWILLSMLSNRFISWKSIRYVSVSADVVSRF
jgi:tubulin---tyrosine ligase